MTTPQNNGGPAFPIPTLEREYWDRKQGEPNGMSLRDWFAGMALQGALACPGNSGKFADFASDAYQYADAMLAARKEGA